MEYLFKAVWTKTAKVFQFSSDDWFSLDSLLVDRKIVKSFSLNLSYDNRKIGYFVNQATVVLASTVFVEFQEWQQGCRKSALLHIKSTSCFSVDQAWSEMPPEVKVC